MATLKVLVSSKLLYEQLNKLDLQTETIVSASVENEQLTLNTNQSKINIPVKESGFIETMVQKGTRWDFVKLLLSKIDEQPIVLHITEYQIKVIFEY